MERVKEFPFKQVRFPSSVSFSNLSSETKLPEGVHRDGGGAYLPMRCDVWRHQPQDGS